MRREYENKGGGLPEGCVLWLPFTSATDLKDRVTGNDVVIDRPEFMYWDDTYQAFYFGRTNTTYTHTAHLSYPNFRNQFSDDNYSVIFDIARQSGTLVPGSTVLSPYAGEGAGAATTMKQMWGIGSVSPQPSARVRFRVCHLCDATYRTTYVNGVQTRQTGTSRQYWPPSKWLNLINPEITFRSEDYLSRFYLYNIMIFNRKLTIEEAMSL